MLHALFKLVWNTQKALRTNFFEYQGEIFLNIEKVLVKISALPYYFSTHFGDKGVNFLLTHNLRNIAKQNWH